MAAISTFVPAPYEIVDDSYVLANGPNHNRASLLFSFYCSEAATVSFEGEVLAPKSSSNSFYVVVDQGEETGWNISPPNAEWQWDNIHTLFNVSAGAHVLELRHRERGVAIKTIRFERGHPHCGYFPTSCGNLSFMLYTLEKSMACRYAKV